MSEKIEVVRVKPCDLSKGQVFRLNYQYKTELGEFIVLGSVTLNRLYVNESVPEEDIERFLQICEYDGPYINDDTSPVAGTNDYIYEKYGWPVWNVLQDEYSKRRKKREKIKAKSAAGHYFKLIEKYRMAEDSEISFHNAEYVAYELKVLADNTGRKTVNNCVGIGTEYVFLLGYLIGKGIINIEEVQRDAATV